jgi:acetyl esterase/lipase
MSRWNKWLTAAAGALLIAGGGFVCVNRDKTRLRLAQSESDVAVARDVVYVTGSSNPKHVLDVYSPKQGKDAPVIHFVHGGYWVEGDKDHYQLATGLYGSVGVALAKRGVVTVVQSYRLSPEVDITGIVDDVMAALRWTQAHAAEHGGDPKRIFMMGHSAGGHLVAMVGTNDALHGSRGMDPAAVRGYVPLSAVWDVSGMKREHGEEWNEGVTYRVFGREPTGWTTWSPLERLHAGVRPFFVVIGEHDFPYMIPQAEQAKQKLEKLGAPVKYFLVPGASHADIVLRFGAKDDDITGPVVQFVTETR